MDYLGCDVIELKTAASTGTNHLLSVRFSMCLNSAGNFIKPEPDIAKTLQEFAEVRGPGTSAHMRRLLPKGSWGLVFKTRFSSLNTFHPWTKVSVVVCADATLAAKTFLPVTSLVCVVFVANPL